MEGVETAEDGVVAIDVSGRPVWLQRWTGVKPLALQLTLQEAALHQRRSKTDQFCTPGTKQVDSAKPDYEWKGPPAPLLALKDSPPAENPKTNRGGAAWGNSF